MTVNPNANVCHACAACRAGRYNLCGAIFENSIGLGRDGGMAEAVALDEVYLRRPFRFPLDSARGLDGAAGSRRPGGARSQLSSWRAHRRDRRRTNRLACGSGAASAGATSIGVIEPTEFRRKKALEVGATEAFAPGAETVAQFTTGEGPSYVFECSGHPTALQTAVSMVGYERAYQAHRRRPPANRDEFGGRIEQRGHDLSELHLRRGVEIAIDLLAAGAIDVDALTSDVLELRQYADAFSRLRGG